MKIIKKCPNCNTKLEAIPDEEDFIIDWFCPKCCISWDLEDLEYEPVQKEITIWK